MSEKLDKFFTPRSLLIINAAIILFSETMGNLFLETGTIHFIAVLFIILAVSRIFIHYYTFDPVLEKFIHASSLALLFFAGSHFMEFLGYKLLNLPEDALFANVVNFYLISILFVIIGTELFLRIYYRRSHFFAMAVRNYSDDISGIDDILRIKSRTYFIGISGRATLALYPTCFNKRRIRFHTTT